TAPTRPNKRHDYALPRRYRRHCRTHGLDHTRGLMPHHERGLRFTLSMDVMNVTVTDRCGRQPNPYLTPLRRKDIEILDRQGRLEVVTDRCFHFIPPPASHHSSDYCRA